ncbi:MAG: hypothetical protein KC416_02000 [Myxococcales bacterium]|nr:hypothetical protein [Myxococcales bacterium]
MSIVAVHSSPPVQSPSIEALKREVGVNPQGVMMILRKRMGALDSQIAAIMDEMDRQTTRSNEINQRLALLRPLTEEKRWTDEGGIAEREIKLHLLDEVQRNDKASPEEIARAKEHVDEVFAALRAEGYSDFAESWSTAQDFASTYPQKKIGDRFISNNDMKRTVAMLEAEQKELSAGNELMMVKLQSLVAQRGNELSLATNILQSINQNAQKIADNIR